MSPFPHQTKLGYQPVLDGIRGLAVALVVGFNFKWGWLPGGFIGVDIFFALSGFLITTLLLEEGADKGSISFRKFLLRRGVRLYPALLLVAGAIVLFSSLLQDSAKATANARIAGAALAWCANWLCAADPFYASLALGHTWSLGVEFQFYLLWAGLIGIIFYASHGSLRLVGMLAAGIALGSAGWRIYLWIEGVSWIDLYLRTDTRLDGLLIGALAAVGRRTWVLRVRPDIPPKPRAAIVYAVAVFSLMALAWAATFWAEHDALPYWGGFSLVAVATSVLILFGLGFPASLIARSFRFPLMVWLGKISYSLYLWHVPVASLLRPQRLAQYGFGPVTSEFIRFSVSMALAAGSYYLVEQRVLGLRRRLGHATKSDSQARGDSKRIL